jgi:hypothetical protein
MPAYMYEDLKKMVYADDPEAVRHVGDWLGSRGRLISDFAATVHRELSKVDDLYSSAEGAPRSKPSCTGPLTSCRNSVAI